MPVFLAVNSGYLCPSLQWAEYVLQRQEREVRGGERLNEDRSLASVYTGTSNIRDPIQNVSH